MQQAEIIRQKTEQYFLEFEKKVAEKSPSIKRWEDVPVEWYMMATKKGMLKWDNEAAEKNEILAFASNYANVVFADEMRGYIPVTDDSLKAYARTCAGKIAVWIKLLGRENPADQTIEP